ncbi:MAG: branched-chain amino acid ABC transporter ATP-binding protein [Spirochaetes bacterium]|nr:MAG: branched-chain amino acid ABC transporter ATP-binding protein [Spirochaetota bacterium]
MKEMLVVENLNAGYGKVPILKDVSIRVNEGEVVAIIGPNGAGKSTLLKNVSGLLNGYSGKIRFTEQNIESLPAHKVTRLGISYVPEGGRLFPNMTVRENLLMGAFCNREEIKKGILNEIYELFPVLKDRARQFARTLSGGEKQMLAIARGMVSRPNLIMLDEPSLGLAPNLVDSIYERLKALKERGLTILLVEQNTNYALEFSDRGYVLENGSIVMEGSGKDLAVSEHIKRHYLGL